MPVRELFVYPTVSLLSHYIEAAQNNGKAKTDVVPEGHDLDLAAEVDKHDQAVLE